MKCRNPETRVRIVNSYNITPLAHTKLLAGQRKSSCTNVTLTDNYYCFDYVNKIDSADKGTFFAGSGASKHFLSLIGHFGLPLFNPLISIHTGGLGGARGISVQRNATNKQLYNAINLLSICWDFVPGGIITSIKARIDSTPQSSPRDGDVKSINTIISKFSRGQTLQQMINAYRQDNQIRQFDFSLLNGVLVGHKQTSYFG